MADTFHPALFYDSNDVNGTQDRLYGASSFENLFKAFFTSGINPNVGGKLAVRVSTASNNQLIVGTGVACLDGKVRVFDSETVLTVDLSQATAAKNEYMIVVERNDAERDITIKFVNGTDPVRDLSGPSRVYQLTLARLTLQQGCSTLNSETAQLIDVRDDAKYCGFIERRVDLPDMEAINAKVDAYIESLGENLKSEETGDDVSLKSVINSANNAVEKANKASIDVQAVEAGLKDLLSKLKEKNILTEASGSGSSGESSSGGTSGGSSSGGTSGGSSSPTVDTGLSGGSVTIRNMGGVAIQRIWNNMKRYTDGDPAKGLIQDSKIENVWQPCDLILEQEQIAAYDMIIICFQANRVVTAAKGNNPAVYDKSRVYAMIRPGEETYAQYSYAGTTFLRQVKWSSDDILIDFPKDKQKKKVNGVIEKTATVVQHNFGRGLYIGWAINGKNEANMYELYDADRFDLTETKVIDLNSKAKIANAKYAFMMFPVEAFGVVGVQY